MAGDAAALGYDHPTLDEQAATPVLGHGERVGEIRPAAEAFARSLTRTRPYAVRALPTV